MKITRTTAGGAARVGAPSGQKNLSGLVKGDTFTATVVGVSGGEVSLMLGGGGRFTAKTGNPGALQNGEKLSFTVEENKNGQLFVKMTKDDEEKLTKIALKELENAGLPVDDENIALAKALAEKGIPFKKLNEASKGLKLKSMTLEKLLFLLEEKISVNEGSLRQLNNCVINKDGLEEELSRLIDMVTELPDSERHKAALLLMGEDGEPPRDNNRLKKALKSVLFLDIGKSGKKSVSGFFDEMYSSVLKLIAGIETIGKSGSDDKLKKLLLTANGIKKAVEFQNSIKQYRQYVQLPFILDGYTAQGDLYVFTGESNPGHAGYEKRLTALLSLDLSIGRVEAFIVKKGASVTCDFGLSEPKYLKLFNDNRFELHKLLAQKGLKLERASFEPLNGAFNLLTEQPSAEKAPEQAKRVYSFDMKA